MDEKRITKRIDIYREEIEKNRHHAPVGELIEMAFTGVDEGKAIFELEVQQKHMNSVGTVQGGVLTILADAAMGIAFGSLLSTDQGFSTIEAKINFIRPVFEGHLEAVGTVTSKGKRVGMAECNIYLKKNKEDNNPGKLAARATSSLILL